ncbi:YiiX/YebB-like N1pC/P60 family cysteine hydrolase [Reinekea blandensis]|uniref:Protein tyrosine/serine phosphatase n=1 Tax=Reinekea blandensis MED297 TaxID=314283 RepID=A4BJV2_9GAMM|nr:YiiX/YebB-like N1pC/P60 family cysteine hydrolase [Reinekea blandensis]EAR07619.1 protein tyrosine/serine phosphatase [Reinekea sp. MED297] [Reinekea blandensis MED297]
MSRYQTLLLITLLASLLAGGRAFATVQDPTGVILAQRSGLVHLLEYIDARPELFARESAERDLLNRTERQQVLEVWVLYLDYMTTVRRLADLTADYHTLSGSQRRQRQHQHLLAFNTHYRFALEFIRRIERDPELVDWLNTPHPEQSLESGFYQRFVREMLSDWMTDRYDSKNARLDPVSALPGRDEIDADIQAIRQLDRTGLLASNAFRAFRRTAYSTYYPLQKGVARGMGKIKLWRFNKTLITPEQARAFSQQFEPGDFYLTRKEWRLTNAGIPGFWTHSALYIGSRSERNAYFDTPAVRDWVRSQGFDSFEAMLQSISPVYAEHPGVDAMGTIRVLEALDAGVIFNSIETSLDADGAAVFRPMTTRLEKAKAIAGAFGYIGRPYDFHFDFDSDTALVCSELIFKAYQPATSQAGIQFPLNRAVGRKMLTPNEIAQWYEQTLGTEQQQIELVMFIDSNERDQVAFQSTKAAFLGSWRRSDWHFLQQPSRQNEQLASTDSQ